MSTAAEATRAKPGPGPARARAALTLASLGFFLITLDILIVNVALPRLGEELGGGTAGRQWVIDGYTLAFASLLLFAGNLSDRIGAKRAFGAGTALFTLTSAACALAPTMGLLVLARCLQGAAAALMLPASMALIREAYPDPRRRAGALGIWAVGGAVAGAAGPILGGLLTTLDWRLVFAINLPVGLVMLALLPRLLPSPTRPVPFDRAGQVLAVITLAALVGGFIEGGQRGFTDPWIVLLLLGAAAGLGGFLLIQARTAHPMLPLGLLRPAGMRIALTIGFAFMVAWFGTVFITSLFLQQTLGLSPLHAGLAFLPSAAASVAGNLGSGPLTNRFGTRAPVMAGLGAIVVGLLGLVASAPLESPWLVAILVMPVGAGGSLAMPPATGLVLASVPEHQAGIASAVFNTFRQIGGALAVAVFGVLVAEPRPFVTGLQLSLGTAAALALVAAFAARGIGRQGCR